MTEGIKTKWQGLWKQRKGVYTGATIKKTEIPKYAKLIVRYNKFHESDSNRPKFVYCFASGDSAKAITMEVDSKEYKSLADRIEELEEQIATMYTYEQVRIVMEGVCRDTRSGYDAWDLLIEDYI